MGLESNWNQVPYAAYTDRQRECHAQSNSVANPEVHQDRNMKPKRDAAMYR
jgi:hypothetical protein